MNINTSSFSLNNFIFYNGILDLLNVFFYWNFNFCVYNFIIEDLNNEYLYFAFLYGSIRIFESMNEKKYFLTNITYISEMIYYNDKNILISIACSVISFCIMVRMLRDNEKKWY